MKYNFNARFLVSGQLLPCITLHWQDYIGYGERSINVRYTAVGGQSGTTREDVWYKHHWQGIRQNTPRGQH